MPDNVAAEESPKEDSMQELLLQYTFYHGIRQTRSEKEDAYLFIDQSYQEMGYPIEYGKLSAGITKYGYCVAGDLDAAKEVFIAPFDTRNKTYFRWYTTYPFDEKRNSVQNGVAAVVDTVLCVALAVGVYALLAWLLPWRWLAVLGGVVVLAVYMLLRRNPFNFSTGAPLALMHYIAGHRAKKKRYAFVFLDKSTDNYIPLKLFLVKYKRELRGANHVWYLSNLAHGQKLAMGAHAEDEGAAEAARALGAELVCEGLPRCFDEADNLVLLTSVENDGAGRPCAKDTRSKRDKKMDVPRLKALAEAFIG